MVERRIHLGRYAVVGLLAFLIFSLGISLGMVIDNERVRWSMVVNQEQQAKYKSLQFQYLYLSGLTGDNSSCPVFKKTLEASIADLGSSLDKIKEYQQESRLNDVNYDLVSREYILDNLRYWLFARQTRSVCSMNLVTALYFYSDKNCDICPDQGVILTYFKNLYGDNLLVFPINVDYESEENSVMLLKSRYNITVLPSVVVEDVTYSGVVQKDELQRILCSNYKQPIEGCQ
jgi:hypothetical protein